MEQAKKRDRKIMITDVALNKVPLVQVPEFTQVECETVAAEHRTLLRVAKEKNHSNEVLSVVSFKQVRRAMVLGEAAKEGLLMLKVELPQIKDQATREELDEMVKQMMQEKQPLDLKQAMTVETAPKEAIPILYREACKISRRQRTFPSFDEDENRSKP